MLLASYDRSSRRNPLVEHAHGHDQLEAGRRAVGFANRLALLDIEARHYRRHFGSHYDPNQPRVPAGHPDGGQWTRDGREMAGVELVALDRRRRGIAPVIEKL